ncbi:MAG: NUDIX domain-containing protein [Thermodesulfobacteriota bacterium]
MVFQDLTPDEYFRAGVGAAITDGEGRVLTFERTGRPGVWQLPQGGLDAGEEPDQAVLREVWEETGIGADALVLLAAHPEPLAYELPVPLRRRKFGRGQVQYWYLFRLLDEGRINLCDSQEFTAWQWMSWPELIAATVEFRRPLYRRLLECFGPFLEAGSEKGR